jgi:hypothetical protein
MYAYIDLGIAYSEGPNKEYSGYPFGKMLPESAVKEHGNAKMVGRMR